MEGMWELCQFIWAIILILLGLGILFGIVSFAFKVVFDTFFNTLEEICVFLDKLLFGLLRLLKIVQ